MSRGGRWWRAGALCERKNGRGVDTNRNWEVHWGFKETGLRPLRGVPGREALQVRRPLCTALA